MGRCIGVGSCKGGEFGSLNSPMSIGWCGEPV